VESQQKNVYVVDDDVSVRTALTRSLEKRGYSVSTYNSGTDFLDNFSSNLPGCLVLDVRMPGMSGLDLQETVATRYPSLPIIFITGHGDIPMSVRAMKSGAFEFLEKPYPVEALQEHIEKALVKSAELQEQENSAKEINQRFEKLTSRELDVMRLLVAGVANNSNKEIARQLDISHRTVDDHRARIMSKMQARSLAELVEMSKICGIHEP
jgi:FixJ family two-component response regulator